MDNALQILVIILASFLGLFLLLAIVALVKVIQLIQHLKSISEKAEQLANTAESVGDFFKYTAGPAAIGKLLSNVTEFVLNHRKKGDKS